MGVTVASRTYKFTFSSCDNLIINSTEPMWYLHNIGDPGFSYLVALAYSMHSFYLFYSRVLVIIATF